MVAMSFVKIHKDGAAMEKVPVVAWNSLKSTAEKKTIMEEDRECGARGREPCKESQHGSVAAGREPWKWSHDGVGDGGVRRLDGQSREEFQGNETGWDNSLAAWQGDHGGVLGRVRAGGVPQAGHSSGLGNVMKLVKAQAWREGNGDTPRRGENEATLQPHQQPSGRWHREATWRGSHGSGDAWLGSHDSVKWQDVRGRGGEDARESV